MRVIVNSSHAKHIPPHECDNGAAILPHEVPGRFDAIRAALQGRGGFTFEASPRIAETVVTALHDAEYVAFLRETSAELAGVSSTAPKFTMPSVFPFGPSPRARSAKALLGTYCFDTYTPITPGAYDAAVGGAAAALHAAEQLANETE